MMFLLFFLFGSSALTFALARTIYSDTVTYRLLADSTQSYLAADSGVEDTAYRFVATLAVDASETVVMGNAVATTEYVFDNVSDKYNVVATGIDNDAYRSTSMELFTGSGASFNFGVQSGNGGFIMGNSATVQGNVFSNGTIMKDSGGTATIYGDAISSGPTGLIVDITATGTARARTIRNTNVGEDAYAYTLDGGLVSGDAYINTKLDGAVVVGSEYPHEPEEATTTMPISDDDIDAIKQDIIDTGTVIASTDPECLDGEYDLSGTDLTIGFLKIECDFTFKKGSGATLTLTGSIWVEGNVTFFGGPDVVIDAGVGNRTVPFIVDNESDRSASSMIMVQTGTTFTGSGSPKSYILLISQNDDAENSLGNTAISLSQSSAGDLLVYASHGKVVLGNSISLKEVTGYLIDIGQSSEIIYESGLVNLLFTSGPGGGFTIGSWSEVY